jgi:amino acid permease
MSATTLPLVAAMLSMALIEIAVAVDCNGQGIYLRILPFFVLVVLLLTICFVIRDGKSALQLAQDEGRSAFVNALQAAGAH